jgi:putative transposase
MDYHKDEHRVHLIVYHLVWCPRRRKSVLTGPIAKDCHDIITRKCEEKGWHILEFVVQPDHIHVCVQAFPEIPASVIVKECKGRTSFELRKKYPAELKKLPSLWTRSYFAATAGNVSQRTIQHYLEAQKGI